MGRIHQVLRWANRREVAREVTRQGYRVSGETLNRWVRDDAEFPAVVERIVYELFTITDSTNSPPAWAEGLEQRLTDVLLTNRDAILANRETVVQALAEQAARYGVERALGAPPHAEPAPDKRGGRRTQAAQK